MMSEEGRPEAPRKSTRMSFPRTMSRGHFAGQHFETLGDYQRALREDRERTQRRAKEEARADRESAFLVRIHSGTFHAEMRGDPSNPEDIERLTQLIGRMKKGEP